MQVTIIDDNLELLEVYKEAFHSDFQLKTFSDPIEGMTFIEKVEQDLVVIDLHMPGKDGFEVYKQIKKWYPTLAVLFLTGDSNLTQKLKGLALGADDFLVKPIATEELRARILNRIGLNNRKLKAKGLIEVKDLIIDTDSHAVTLSGKPIRLTQKEFMILLTLSQNLNKVVTKDVLLSLLWSDSAVGEGNLDTHFSNMRKKLDPFSVNIKTLKNLGYMLRA